MALGNPIEAFMQMAQAKEKNRQQAQQDAMGIGQNLGQGFNTIAQAMEDKKKKTQWQQTINSLMQNPNLNPQLKTMLPAIAQKPELLGQIGPELLKLGQAPKQPMAWHPVTGMLSKGGKPLEINEATGEYREAPIEAKATGYGGSMGPIRQAQYTLQDLPSNQGMNTAGGAAYQVKVGARQGKNLIARPGSPQRTAAAAADLVRSITRVAPTDEGLKNANFSNNLVSRWSVLKQQLSADPSSVYNSKIRKEMYDIFDEMDKSATPFIQNQLDDMNDAGFPVTPNTRKRQLGLTLPEIPFVAGEDANTQTAQGGWGIQKVQ